jgi:hypothetical protein
MESLFFYLQESLKSSEQKWFEKAYNTNQSLIKDNKLTPIDVDIKKLNKPKKPFDYDKFGNDSTFKKIIGDKMVGFTVSNQMLRNPGQYLKDEDKELQPKCYPYWYVVTTDEKEQNAYFIGLCMYDKDTTYIDNFIHLVSIESSLIVNNSTELNKAILNDFINIVQKDGNYEGITAKPTHPKMKATLIKLGFNSFKDNKEILTYKL